MSQDPQLANATHLRARFVAEVARQRPESVLDVGCGAGAVMLGLRECGIAATGIEASAKGRAAVLAAGFDLLEPTDDGLGGIEDAAFDWVTMRHVPHHLLDPERMVREALRVARRGLVVAEPWFDASVPSQEVARDIDDWMKRGDRRAGRYHATNHDSAQLLAFVPDQGRYVVHWEHYLRLRQRPVACILDESVAYLDALDPNGDEAQRFDELARRAREVGLSCNGSLTMTIRRNDD